MVVRRVPKWCRVCEDYVPNIADHIKQHGIGENSDAKNRKQYLGSTNEKKEDYFVCVLHQKKVPCSSRKFDGTKCDCAVFGMIRKSFMMECIRGLPINIAVREADPTFRHPPFFPVSSDVGNSWKGYLINMDDRTVVIKGVTIHLKF